jgi:isopentenyl diphosphate isomerase/L-lactate dehydrogenase-like FMN-dependent dehydrogenase
MWALETGGTQGIKEMMKMINEELKLSMALTHCS